MSRPIVVCDRATIQWYGKSQDVGVLRIHVEPYTKPAKFTFSCTVEDAGDGIVKLHGVERMPTDEEIQQAVGVGKVAGFVEVWWERADRPGVYTKLRLNRRVAGRQLTFQSA